MLAAQHKLSFLWRFCPASCLGVYDLRSLWGIRELNKKVPKTARAATSEGHLASVPWAKWENKDKFWWHGRRAAAHSYTPHSAFLRKEARLRRLLFFPQGHLSDAACLGRQSTRPVQRALHREPELVQSSSDSGIEDPDSDAPVLPAAKRAPQKRVTSARRENTSLSLWEECGKGSGMPREFVDQLP